MAHLFAPYVDDKTVATLQKPSQSQKRDKAHTAAAGTEFIASASPLISEAQLRQNSPLDKNSIDKNLVAVSVPVVASGTVASDGVPSKKMSFLASILRGGHDAANVKTVYMPYSEYVAHFVRDGQGTYAGTEPERQWTAEELEEKYEQYAKEIPKAKLRLRMGALLTGRGLTFD